MEKLIKGMSTKSCELDAMPTNILKNDIILKKILPVITKLINLSLQQGVFAKEWKLSIVRPTLKKIGLELLLDNYRPVSNLSFLSKVLEKAALVQLMEHCGSNDLLPDYQSAYRESYSCETALVKIFNDILWKMEKQEVTALVAIDLSAAFDTVDHDILLDVLSMHFGIVGVALSWLESYLRCRKFKVNVGSEYSPLKDVMCSVPQGSCLGPVLYLIYASTIADIIPENLHIYGYADDHALSTSFKPSHHQDECEGNQKLQGICLAVKDWMDSNRLKMNPSKTEYIYFGSSYQLTKCENKSLDVNGELVERTEVIKYLGAYMDEQLNMQKHITEMCRKAMYGLYRLKQVRTVLTDEAAETIAVGIVMSHLDYSNAILIGLPQHEINRLQRVQVLAARAILGRKAHESSTRCLKQLHWLPIHLRIEHKVLTLVFKALKGTAPQYLKDMLKLSKSVRQLRSNNMYMKLDIPRVKRESFANRSFSVMGPRLWNDIPNDVKQCVNVETFKKKLKTFLFNKF